MLRELRIANVAIIDELHLTFAPGLNVLTGETGAGKSIIMRAVGLLCGGRANVEIIRSDAEEATIEGVFDVESGEWLSALGLEPADEVLVRRVVSRSGKGRVAINGSVATAAVLTQVGDRLIHIYGQHDHALLLKPDSHLYLVDAFAKLLPQRQRMAAAYGVFREAADALAGLTAGNEAARQRSELLRFQVGELHDAQVQAGEEAALQQEREVQRHAEKLTQICQGGEDALYSGDGAMAAGLARIAAQIEDAARIEPTLSESAELLRQAAAEIEDVALRLRHAAERIRHDPQRLETIDERLIAIGRLKRKYDCVADELPARLAELQAELGHLDSAGMDVTAARQRALDGAAEAWAIARELSAARQTAAAELDSRMGRELRALGMGDAVFRTMFTVTASDARHTGGAAELGGTGLTASGADVIEFYFCANPGEGPKPLARVGSGGELSRIMLALKALTAGAGDVPTLLFDEVDAGIGGLVADAVGRRLQALGRGRQVLCITHLPQIAAVADHHFAVEKHVSRGRTRATARALDADERVQEISRMLGSTGQAESVRYARRLIEGVAPRDTGTPARRRLS